MAPCLGRGPFPVNARISPVDPTSLVELVETPQPTLRYVPTSLVELVETHSDAAGRPDYAVRKPRGSHSWALRIHSHPLRRNAGCG